MKLLPLLLLPCIAFAEVTVTEKPDRVSISIDGALFTEYRHGDAPHVYWWPIIGPGGVKMTRSFPMDNVEGEDRDHPHHRSLWFSHGLVNGVDFWTEAASHKGEPKHPVGRIEHVKLLTAEGGKESGVVSAEQRWVSPDGSVPLTSKQSLRVFSTPATERVVDFEIELKAGDKDVVLGDTKEGTAAIRIAESMRLKAKSGPGKGSIINSEGIEGAKVWGQAAKWVTMTGPIGEKTYSITMMDHPANLRHPTRWHARDYGLFAANPFCGNEMDKSIPKGEAAYTLKAGERLNLKYRIIFSEGDAKAVKASERFAAFAK